MLFVALVNAPNQSVAHQNVCAKLQYRLRKTNLFAFFLGILPKVFLSTRKFRLNLHKNKIIFFHE